MSGRALASIAMGLVLAVSGGCAGTAGPDADPTTAVGSPTSAVTLAPTSTASTGVDPGAPLFGTWVATIPPGLNAAPGEWMLTVDAGGWAFTHPDGHTFSPGAVKAVTEAEITLAADPNCPVQSGTPTDGRYRWSVEAGSLTLEVVSDSCQDRIDTLTSDSWSRRR
jgi:hypothetical protein